MQEYIEDSVQEHKAIALEKNVKSTPLYGNFCAIPFQIEKKSQQLKKHEIKYTDAIAFY